MHIFRKGPLWRITIEGRIRAGCGEISRTKECATWPVYAPPPSSSHPRFPMHATRTGVLWWVPRLLHVGYEGIVCSMGLLVPLVQRGKVLLGQLSFQNEKSQTTTRRDVSAAVPPYNSQMAILPWMDRHMSPAQLLSGDLNHHHLGMGIAESELEELIDGHMGWCSPTNLP